MVRMVELADNFKAAIITMFSNKWKGRQSRQRKNGNCITEKKMIVEVFKKAQ